jgi:hypothetical protein
MAKKHGKGYSIKDTNANGKYTIYIWDKDSYDSKTISRIRKETGNKNYAKMDGWRPIGRYDKPETYVELEAYLLEVFGYYDAMQVKASIDAEIEIKERKRIAKEKEAYREIIDQIIDLLNEKNQRLEETPKTIKEAKKVLRKLNKAN